MQTLKVGSQDARLEGEFGNQLNQPGSSGAHYLPEVGAADVAGDGRGAVELRVVEDIEGFHAFFRGHIKVV